MDGLLSVRDDHPIPGLDGPITSSVHRTSTYDIHVTCDEDAALSALAEVLGDRLVAMITDETVDKLYAGHMREWLTRRGLRVRKIAIPPGEQSKSLPMACHLLDWLAQTDTRRRDILRQRCRQRP